MYPIEYKPALIYGKHFSGALSDVGKKTGLRSEKLHWETLWYNI